MVLGLVAALTGCDQPPSDRAFVDGLKAEFDSQLFDYPSARFRNVRFSRSTGIACGDVNSRNQFGAYVGWRSFNAMEEGADGKVFVLIEDEEEPATSSECGTPAGEWKSKDFASELTVKTKR